MQPQTNPENEQGLARYLPLAVWVLAVVVLVLIPLKIAERGYVPGGEAMGHVARALSEKTWPEILVLREGFSGDEQPGWHAILGALHRGLGWNADALMTFSICVPVILFWLVLLFTTRKRPEAMLLVLFLASVAASGTFARLLSGRPFIFTMTAVVVLLQLWTRVKKISPWLGAVSVALIGASIWVQGNWYCFGLLVVAFALAGEGRKAFSLMVCWLAGALLGAGLTGQPAGYLKETWLLFSGNFGGGLLERMMVPELRPGSGDLIFVEFAAVLLLWRLARGEWNKGSLLNPLFLLAALGWLLGLKASRCWTDWGFPAALLWLATELEAVLEAKRDQQRWQSLLLAVFAGAGVFIATTRDLGNRWTADLTVEQLTPETPGIDGWLPENGGIVYSSDAAVFFRTFYKNPRANWRYVLGFEPGLMRPDDLAIFRKIQWNWFAAKAYESWVAKMRPADRMMLLQGGGSPPGVKGLEWYYAATDTWIGRLPRTDSLPAIKP